MTLVGLGSSGCGVLIQTAMGWSAETKHTETQRHTVALSSSPDGAELRRKRPGGEELVLGTAPLTDSIDYQVEVTVESPRVGGLIVGGLLDLVAGVAVAAVGASDGNAIMIILGAYAIGLGGVPELLAALIYGLSGDSTKSRLPVESTRDVVYTARLAGLPELTKPLRIPDQTRLELALGHPGSVAAGGTTGGPAQPPRPSPEIPPERSWVIAVMDVEAQSLDRTLLANLGEQLRVFIAAQKVRTIDKGAQEKVLKEQISSLKSESFAACYDDACQLELGKALAASHILRSRATRFGTRCVLNTELIDLVSEVTVAASSSQGECDPEGFLAMCEDVAKKLFRR